MEKTTRPKLLIVDDEPDAVLILAKTLLAREAVVACFSSNKA